MRSVIGKGLKVSRQSCLDLTPYRPELVLYLLYIDIYSAFPYLSPPPLFQSQYSFKYYSLTHNRSPLGKSFDDEYTHDESYYLHTVKPLLTS